MPAETDIYDVTLATPLSEILFSLLYLRYSSNLLRDINYVVDILT